MSTKNGTITNFWNVNTASTDEFSNGDTLEIQYTGASNTGTFGIRLTNVTDNNTICSNNLTVAISSGTPPPE